MHSAIGLHPVLDVRLDEVAVHGKHIVTLLDRLEPWQLVNLMQRHQGISGGGVVPVLGLKRCLEAFLTVQEVLQDGCRGEVNTLADRRKNLVLGRR